MGAQVEQRASERSDESSPERSRSALRVGTAVAPWSLPLLAASVVLHSAGVPVAQTLLFLGVQILAYTVPGALWWRAIRGRADSVVSDLVFGSILGHALTIGLYLVVRWWGFPSGVWLFAGGTVVCFLAVPGLRRHWRFDAVVRAPIWYSCSLAATAAIAVFLLAPDVPRVDEPAIRWPGPDTPYLLSLAAELKHHVPPRVPFVVGQPLNYHWFTFADIAAISWQGGQELDVLTLALLPVWCAAIAMVAFGALGTRLARSYAVGAAAAWVAVLVGTISVLGWWNPWVTDSTLLRVLWTYSPTMGFALVIAMPTLLVFIDILRGSPSRGRDWFLAVVLSLTLMGAKATVLPVLGAGLLLCFVLSLKDRGAVARRSFMLGALVAAELLFAQFVLFGGASQGLRLSLTGTIQQFQAPLGLGTGDRGRLVVVVLFVFGWLAPLCASLCVVFRRRQSGRALGSRKDPAVALLVGMVLAGVASMLVFVHPGYSQFFFLRAGLPFGYLLVAWGLVVVFREHAPNHGPLLAVAAVVGVGTVLLTRHLTPELGDRPHAWRVVTVLVLAALTPVVLVLAARVVSGTMTPGLALALVSVAFVGMGSIRTWDMTSAAFESLRAPDVAPLGTAAIPRGGITAARYVRERSGEDDLIATNAHCRWPGTSNCKNTAHWMSGWFERRVVVEGWGYTAPANLTGTTITQITYSPFWDDALLALNDRVFTAPSRAHLADLVGRYPVRWLVVDLRFPADVAGLKALLPRHHTFGQTLVLEVPR